MKVELSNTRSRSRLWASGPRP